MIVVACPACRQQLKVRDELRGKAVKCPGCGRVISTPAAGAAQPAPLAVPAQPPPAAGHRPGIEDDRTLPPRVPAPSPPAPPQAIPLGPPGSPVARPPADSSSDGDTDAGLTGAVGHPAKELTDFLSPPQAPGEIGRLGPYRVLAVLGRGGMGVVYRAEDPHLGRPVALKAMLPALATSPTARERFFREARAAAALKHPHIVTIHQVGEDRGAPFLAMEFLDGESLDQRIKREGRLPVPEVLRIGREVARGLAAAHERGLAHRDVKPANIWLEGKEGHVKILDFGLARSLADQTHLTQSGAIVGTPAFMAPEQAMGRPVDHRCDLFSLGCVLYRLATGELPFKGNETLAILAALATDTPRTPRDVNPAVPAALSDLVMRLLAKRPEDRPGTAQEVAEALAAMSEDHTALVPQPGRPPHPPRLPGAVPWRGRRGLVACLAVVLLLVVVAVVWVSSRKDRAGLAVAPTSQGGGAGPAGGQEVPKEFTNGAGMEFVLVPRGKFWMGGGNGTPGDKEVEIPYDFYLGKYEVTQEEWEKVAGVNLCYFSPTGMGKDQVKGVPEGELKRFPVENVSWDDARLFAEELNRQEKDPGWVYRLPREVEWEYACRGGPSPRKLEYGADFYFKAASTQLLPKQANFNSALKRTFKMGIYKPNRLGLFDMHGNVAEWCEDEVQQRGYNAGLRVSRGGAWDSGPWVCRAANRVTDLASNRTNEVGVRLAQVPVGTGGK